MIILCQWKLLDYDAHVWCVDLWVVEVFFVMKILGTFPTKSRKYILECIDHNLIS